MIGQQPVVTRISTHHEVSRGPVTGIGFTINYAGETARVSIPDFALAGQGEVPLSDRLVKVANALKEGDYRPRWTDDNQLIAECPDGAMVSIADLPQLSGDALRDKLGQLAAAIKECIEPGSIRY